MKIKVINALEIKCKFTFKMAKYYMNKRVGLDDVWRTERKRTVDHKLYVCPSICCDPHPEDNRVQRSDGKDKRVETIWSPDRWLMGLRCVFQPWRWKLMESSWLTAGSALINSLTGTKPNTLQKLLLKSLNLSRESWVNKSKPLKSVTFF